jgi:hypothetical protein
MLPISDGQSRKSFMPGRCGPPAISLENDAGVIGLNELGRGSCVRFAIYHPPLSVICG